MNPVAQSGVMNKYGHWIILGLVALGVMTLVFSVNGVYDTRIDAPIYATQITSFAEGMPFVGDATVMLRLFKPLYAIIGGTIFHTTHPYGTILALNIVFYVLLIGVVYRIFRELEYGQMDATVGAVWIATAYPLLKYGLALGTDMSGWLLSALTILLGLVAFRKNSNFLLSLASIVGFLGATAKESGVLGLVALCLLVVWRFRRQGMKTLSIKILSVGLPAVVLYGVLLTTIAGHAPTFLDWFSANNNEYSGTHTYSIFKLLAVEASTFGLYWLGVLYAVILMIRARFTIKYLDVVIVSCIATATVLLWPLFISRILFVQFLWVMPLALYAFSHIKRRVTSLSRPRQCLVVSILIIVPIIFNGALFVLSSGGSLFSVFH